MRTGDLPLSSTTAGCWLILNVPAIPSSTPRAAHTLTRFIMRISQTPRRSKACTATKRSWLPGWQSNLFLVDPKPSRDRFTRIETRTKPAGRKLPPGTKWNECNVRFEQLHRSIGPLALAGCNASTVIHVARNHYRSGDAERLWTNGNFRTLLRSTFDPCLALDIPHSNTMPGSPAGPSKGGRSKTTLRWTCKSAGTIGG